MEINHRTAMAIHKTVEYLIKDEKKHYEESEKEEKKDHIYKQLVYLNRVWESMYTEYILIIDIDERSYFDAHVEPLLEESEGVIVFEYGNSNDEKAIKFQDLIEEGYLRYSKDTKGLLKYLVENELVPPNSTLICRE